MRLNRTDFLHRAQHPLLMALAAFPAAMFLTLTAEPVCFPWCWGFPAVFVLAAWACLLIPGRARLLAATGASLLMAAAALVLLHWRAHIALLLTPLLYIALLWWTLPIGSWPANRELPIGWYAAGVLSHLAMQILINGSRLAENDAYDPAQTPLLISFLTFAALLLMAFNRASLDVAAQSRRKVPLLMRQQNRVITLVLLLVSILVSALPAIAAALRSAWDACVLWILRLISFLTSLLPLQDAGVGGPGAGSTGDMGLGEGAAPSAFALLMEKILTVAVQLLIAAALVALLYLGSKKLWKLLQVVWGRMLRYASVASEDYEDEIASTWDEPDTERESLLARMRRVVPLAEKGRTPAEQVRLRYRRLRQEHRDWSAAATARETLPSAAATLYERARYAGHDLTDEEAARFREGTRRL